MATIVIASYEKEEFDAVTAIWFDGANSMGVAMPVTLADLRERWPKEIAAGWKVYVACDGDTPVAFMALNPGKVDQLFVRSAYQGQGIGRRLLDMAKKQMPDGFYLTTAIAGRAHDFYQREGLVRGEISRHRFGHEIVRYDWRA
jgi:GNAT superfamily N-acetyltransferase